MTDKNEARTEQAVVSAGHPQLSGAELEQLLVGKTCRGLYRGGFRFIAYVGEDYAMEGRNHLGAHNFGVCVIDRERHTLTVTWRNGWDHTTTRAYRVGSEVRFFDVDGGEWRNTFTTFESGRQALDVR